jgi:hypothetical protein
MLGQQDRDGTHNTQTPPEVGIQLYEQESRQERRKYTLRLRSPSRRVPGRFQLKSRTAGPRRHSSHGARVPESGTRAAGLLRTCRASRA